MNINCVRIGTFTLEISFGCQPKLPPRWWFLKPSRSTFHKVWCHTSGYEGKNLETWMCQFTPDIHYAIACKNAKAIAIFFYGVNGNKVAIAKMVAQPILEPSGNRNSVTNHRCEWTITRWQGHSGRSRKRKVTRCQYHTCRWWTEHTTHDGT